MGAPNPETKANFAACIDACAARAGCKSVDYNADTSACTYLSGAFVCYKFSLRSQASSSQVRQAEYKRFTISGETLSFTADISIQNRRYLHLLVLVALRSTMLVLPQSPRKRHRWTAHPADRLGLRQADRQAHHQEGRQAHQEGRQAHQEGRQARLVKSQSAHPPEDRKTHLPDQTQASMCTHKMPSVLQTIKRCLLRLMVSNTEPGCKHANCYRFNL